MTFLHSFGGWGEGGRTGALVVIITVESHGKVVLSAACSKCSKNQLHETCFVLQVEKTKMQILHEGVYF